MNEPKTEVEINLQFEGLHSWPDAFEEVKFLRSPHRHMFHVQMRKEVHHDDRDVEFIHWKHGVEKYLKTRWTFDLGSTSCEMLARDLFKVFQCSYVKVMEDGENGALITK